MARILESKGHRVNVSCGVHVHVGWQPTFSIQALARLIIITAYLEKGLYAITGTKSREQSVYCGGLKKYGNDKAAKIHLDRERYHILNLTNLATGRKQTVEFRCFSGSTSAIKLVGWIQVCLGVGREGGHCQAKPGVESQAAHRRPEEARRRPVRSRAADALPVLGGGINEGHGQNLRVDLRRHPQGEGEGGI